jgi:serine/threonine protein kinase
MGEVWLARQDGLERHVAVKILLGTRHQPSADRLHREAQALARIKHPHVVPVHEVGEESGLHYYVMDLVDGHSLDDVLAAGALPCRRAANIARQIAEALAAAHDQGVIHRDVKPGNVLLSTTPGSAFSGPPGSAAMPTPRSAGASSVRVISTATGVTRCSCTNRRTASSR